MPAPPAFPILTLPEWTYVTPPATGEGPPSVYGGMTAYDPSVGGFVAFGGCAPAACAENTTWTYADGRWTNVTDYANAPPARVYGTMDYDANMGGVLLYGGYGSASGLLLADTWLYRDGVWQNLTWVGPSPGARDGASMAFDPEPEENGSVLFGGYVSGLGYSNDTWVWQGWSGWVRLTPTLAPPPSDFAQMAYDSNGGDLLLFGCGYGCSVANQTWEFYSGQWWPVQPSGPVPSARTGAAMFYVAAYAEVLMFGGFDTSGVRDDSWVFENGDWVSLTFLVHPSARTVAEVAGDPGSGAVLLAGGLGAAAATLADSWIFEVPPLAGFSPPVPSIAEPTVPVTWTLNLSEGMPPYRATFAFGDGTAGYATATGASLTMAHAYLQTGTFNASVTVTDGAGVNVTASADAVTVLPGPEVTVTATAVQCDVGAPIAFRTNVTSPGLAPLSYVWSFGDGTTATGASPVHAYNRSGIFPAHVTATDALGAQANDTVALTINAAPTLAVAAAPAQPIVGSPLVFYANLTNGTAPFTFAWAFGDGSTSGSISPLHTYSHPGSYTVTVWVNDSSTSALRQSLTVTVGAASTGNGTGSSTGNGAGSAPIWFWIGMGALLVTGGVGVALLVRRRRPPR